MLRFVRHWSIVIALLLVAGCTGGGCSGCSCAGVDPLPQGFEPARRIENAASVRLTDSGINFLEQNIGTLAGTLMGGSGGSDMLTFEIDTQSGSFDVLGFSLVSYEVCPGGPDDTTDPPTCLAEIDLANAQLQIDPEAPHNIRIHGPLPIRIQLLPIDLTWLIIFNSGTDMVANGNGVCPGEPQDPALIDLNANISLEIDNDPAHSRYGYTKLEILDISLPDTGQLSDAIRFCGGGLDTAILNGLKGVLVPLLADSLIGGLTGPLTDQLCQPANPDLTPSCPEGTEDVEGVCRYGTSTDDPCASSLLGLDGHVDLGGLLSSFSPGTEGALDFLFAVGGHSQRTDGTGLHWGDLNPLGAGATLGMYGGTEPRPVSPCVVPADVPLPTDVPIPDELHQNSLPDWPSELDGPHFGLAISERFFNYALAQMYNGGALCLGVTGEGIPELSSNLLAVGLGAPSMVELGRMKAAQQVAIVVRPNQPPVVEFGNGTDIETDPLLRLTLNQLALDFFVWSLDRFVRAMTVTVDVDVPANLVVTPDGLQPVLEDVGINNAVVTNHTLLRDDPETIATAIEELVGSMVGGLIGDAIPAFDLNEQLTSLGLRLDIPASVEGAGSPGLRKLTKDADDYLGIFATLDLATTTTVVQAETTADLAGIELGATGPTREALQGVAFGGADEPRATLRLGSSLDTGAARVEWQYRVDRQPWHPFTTNRSIELSGHWLLRQGRRIVQVRSRVVGQPLTLDPTPAELELTVDDEPPQVRLSELEDGQMLVRAGDRVSPHASLRGRYRLGMGDEGEVDWGEWSDWLDAAELETIDLADEDVVEIEVMDEEGNVGTAQQALIRGRGSSDGSGCSCRVPGGTGHGGLGAFALLGLLGTVVLRRRRRQPGGAGRASAMGLFVVVLFGGASGCSCSDDTAAAPTEPGCRGRGDCSIIEPGLIGAYASAAVAPDGTLWVAGYLEANWEDDLAFGDLVVGPYDGNRVLWSVVDGMPEDEEVDIESYDPKGFRGGKIEPGLDVGLWTSIAIAPDGTPAVAYYDTTNRALRYAYRQGDGWAMTTVDQRDYSDLGRYAKLLFVGGRPAISYLFIQPGEDGAVQSGVRVATGSAPAAGDGQWSFEDASVDPATPCRPAYCRPSARCVASSGLCAATTDGCGDCGGGEECVDVGGQAVCQAIVSSTQQETYPDAAGLYVSAAAHPGGGFGLAFYDRIRGNAMVAHRAGDGWTTVIADGEAGGESTGDKGIGTSLAIDEAGHFHLAYVDGQAEALNYVVVSDGTTPGAPEVVDDGFGAAGLPYADGKHIVGDDAHILLTQGGDIRISYQDASAGTLLVAVGTPATDGHAWQTNVAAQDGFAGFFSTQVHADNAVRVVNWWRAASPYGHGDVAVVSPP